MPEPTPAPHPGAEVVVASATDPRVVALVEALTTELAGGGYSAEQTFGYSAARLAASGVHLVAAEVDGEVDGEVGRRLVGLGGVEVEPDGEHAELKRFYVEPEHRGSGVAAAVLDALVDHARRAGCRVLRLETGDAQHAALAFYRRHGFADVDRFGPYVASATSVCLARTL